MKPQWMFALGLLAGICTMMVFRSNIAFEVARRLKNHVPITISEGRLAHKETKFEFSARGTMEQVAPLMGANRERVWAPGWDPHFLFPKPALDQRGMVFMVAHGPYQVPWVNTEFDVSSGRVQYVYVIPDTLVTVITIRMTPQGDKTDVAVEYDRTALSSQANDHVQRLAENDAKSGPEWEAQINGWLGRQLSSK